MHFIEEPVCLANCVCVSPLHTSKRMHFIEETPITRWAATATGLHTSKRMHFIEEQVSVFDPESSGTCIRQNVCTSLRMPLSFTVPCTGHGLAYVKTYALH